MKVIGVKKDGSRHCYGFTFTNAQVEEFIKRLKCNDARLVAYMPSFWANIIPMSYETEKEMGEF